LTRTQRYVFNGQSYRGKCEKDLGTGHELNVFPDRGFDYLLKVGEIAAGELHAKLCFELARSVFIVE
jgi:hypothetical protein